LTQELTRPAARHEDGEERLMDIAMVEVFGIVLVLVYGVRGHRVRAISLRRASKTERMRYEQAKQN
jgi:uncharacterized DUF497 family protein